MSETDLFEIIRTTRAMRRIKPDPVPEALVRQILEAGICAPSGGNYQRWKFLVIKDVAVKQNVQALYKRAYDEVIGPRYATSAPPPGVTPEKYARQHAAVEYLTDHFHEAPVWIVVCQEDGAATPGRTAGAWWRALAGEGRPKIIARLPFVERPDHPAGMPVYVVSRPIADAAVRDIVLYELALERWREGLQGALAGVGATVESSAGDGSGLNLLVAAPGALGLDALNGALAGLGVGVVQIREIGSHAARFRLAERH